MGRNSDTAVIAGRGVIWITAAKLYFMLGGYAIFFVLPRIFEPRLFGVYSLVVMAVSFLDNAIVTGTIQAVSRYTTRGDDFVEGAKRTGLKVQGILGLVIAGLYTALAEPIALHLLGSPGMVPYMRLSALIVVCYSVYAVFVGSLNGRKLFHRQAILDMIFTTLRAAGILGLAALGWGVAGAVGGFVSAAIVITLLAARVVGWQKPEKSTDASQYLRFASTIMVYTLVLNLILSIDLYFLQGMSSSWAVASGMDLKAAENLSNTLAGQYKAAQVFAFIPYQAIISVTFVVFPLVSSSTHARDTESTRTTIRATMRFALLMIVGLAAVFSANPKSVLDFIYPESYLAAAPALKILSWGIACYGLLAVACTILNGAGMAKTALGITSVTLVLLCIFQYLMLNEAGGGERALTAASTASCVGMLVGLLIAGGILYAKFRAFIPWKSVLRSAAAAAVVMVIGQMIPHRSKLFTLLECVIAFAAYVSVLVVLMEFRLSEFSYVLELVGIRKKK